MALHVKCVSVFTICLYTNFQTDRFIGSLSIVIQQKAKHTSTFRATAILSFTLYRNVAL
jgi:hypothetical protein